MKGYPKRFDEVCVKVGEYVLRGDVYVGARSKIPSYRKKLEDPSWYQGNYASILKADRMGEKKEVLTNTSWVTEGPGGYWVLRPSWEEAENEFGPVSP